MSGEKVPYLRRRLPPRDVATQAKPLADHEALSRDDPQQTMQPQLPAAAISLNEVVNPTNSPPVIVRVARPRGMIRLDHVHPMISLNRMQSAMGSIQLIPELGGRGMDVAWELTDGRNGTLQNIPTDPGRRPLVSWDSTLGFIVGLRHARGVRRLVFYLPSPNAVTLKLFDGTRIACPREMRALAFYRLRDQLYVRSDNEPYLNVGQMRVAYGMAD